MTDLFAPGHLARRRLLRFALGGGGAMLVVGLARAESNFEVTIDNFTFSPPLLRVKRGTEVTWVNHDDIPHSIVLPTLQVHSHAIDTDGQYAYRFDKDGIFNYLCGLHPHMKGQVVVTG